MARFLGDAEEPVPTMVMEPRDYSVIVSSPGELVGLEVQEIRTPRVRTGSLSVSWLIEEGTIVDENQVVARFDESDASLQLEQSQTQLSSYGHRIDQTETDAAGKRTAIQLDKNAAQLDVDFASRQVRQDEQIFSRWEIQESVISAALAEFKEKTIGEKGQLQDHLSESDLRILSIEKQKAETQKELAEETLANLQLRSPRTGVVLHSRRGFDKLDVGATIWPGQVVMSVASLDQFRARVQVDESNIEGVTAGKGVEVKLDARPWETLTGVVEKVSKVAKQIHRDDPRKYFDVDVVLEVPLATMSKLKPGMSLQAEITAATHSDVYVLPKSAVVREEEQFVVFVRSGETFQKSPVRLVASDHGFYILEGLEAGVEVSLQNPFDEQQLVLPDFSAPAANTQQQRFIIFN